MASFLAFLATLTGFLTFLQTLLAGLGVSL
jgi:hypothetical protein